MSQLAPGHRFGSYRIVRLLGQGGMGAVYEAEHEGLGKRVAIKVLLGPSMLDAGTAARFAREGRAAAAIRHPHVVDVTDVGAQDGIPYLVMEMLAGESLGARMERERALRIDELIDLILPIVDALSTAHEHGIVHRDLKPENIFLARGTAGTLRPVLLDFGISKMESAADARLTATSAILGSPYYMSPEQARGLRVIDSRTDQWSLGVILFEALTGNRPIDGESLLDILHRITTQDIVLVTTLRGDLSPQLASVIQRCLKRAPDERFSSMRQLGSALLPFASTRARDTWATSFAGAAGPSAPLNAFAATTPSAIANVGATTDAPREITALERSQALPRAALLGGAAVITLLALAGGAALLVASRLAAPATAELPPSVAAARAPELPPARVAPTPPPAPLALSMSVVPEHAEIVVDGEVVGTGRIERELSPDREHHVIVRAPGFITSELDVSATHAAPPTVELVPEPTTPRASKRPPRVPHSRRAGGNAAGESRDDGRLGANGAPILR